ncbi:MAG: RsmB/NOP family class I SAM-dependent RNA methyltransferase [Melioribacteraceae bacterium]|nr:RsmB/NOP family class I SAM-dependent RNA methyltransferase [Melioribacteraceae bacterium]MCF8264747.1 RsmB/NOP family class I SAM-dependent RNA methyltransferase [Melioribacteraceae bacterium]MCF8413319.1 RsmB/NOP family class I SAM-dependent RNA methyltransferase [Melioribacteraceae bacterium]
MLKLFGDEFLRKYKDFIYSDFIPYLRIPTKNQNPDLFERLLKYGIILEKVDGVETAFQVQSGKSAIGKTLPFILGKYYIQGLSSMIPPIVLDAKSSDKVLDLCAAPGSKSTQISEIMDNRGSLVLNELSLNRIKGLMFNLDKMNTLNCAVIKGKGELLSKYFPDYFDKVLLDAPCSGLGIVQKKGEVSNWWNENQMSSIAELQMRLLVSAIKMTKIGGEIVYSTCTMTIEENELVINKALKNYPVEIEKIDLPVKSVEGFTNIDDYKFHDSLKYSHRIIPWEINSEGFFICKLRKTGMTEIKDLNVSAKPGLQFVPQNHKTVSSELGSFIHHFGIDKSVLENYKYLNINGELSFVNSGFEVENSSLFQRMGVKLGKVDKRGNFILNSNVASIFGEFATKNIVEILNEQEAENYFRGSTVKSDFGSFGQKIVKYNGFFVGTGVSLEEGLKSQFPRSMRTQEFTI